jgi:SAM-dependent methyltransferase
MTSGQDTNSAYVLGHSERERSRLERQASLFAEITRDLLTRAGVGTGMRVLDLGCGVGDVSSIAADLVGPGGAVLGIDVSADAVAVAAERLGRAGKTWARFSAVEIETFDGFAEFDVVIGRFILVHMPDPAALLRTLVQRVAPGATLAFVEMDMSTAAALPPLPLLETSIERITEVYRRAGKQMDAGANLFATFRGAGLKPQLAGFTRISDGAEPGGAEFVTESVRSLMPAMQMLGIASPGDIEIDTLQDRLAAEAAGGEHCIFYPRLVGAWARVAPVEI